MWPARFSPSPQRTIGSPRRRNDSGTVQLNIDTLTTGERASATTTFDGLIEGHRRRHQGGSGISRLRAPNTYLGATTINAGTLLVNGSIAGSTTTVNNTGTARRHERHRGAVNIAGGGTLSPGASAGS